VILSDGLRPQNAGCPGVGWPTCVLSRNELVPCSITPNLPTKRPRGRFVEDADGGGWIEGSHRSPFRSNSSSGGNVELNNGNPSRERGGICIYHNALPRRVNRHVPPTGSFRPFGKNAFLENRGAPGRLSGTRAGTEGNEGNEEKAAQGNLSMPAYPAACPRILSLPSFPSFPSVQTGSAAEVTAPDGRGLRFDCPN
jgi:hypothetical protein